MESVDTKKTALLREQFFVNSTFDYCKIRNSVLLFCLCSASEQFTPLEQRFTSLLSPYPLATSLERLIPFFTK